MFNYRCQVPVKVTATRIARGDQRSSDAISSPLCLGHSGEAMCWVLNDARPSSSSTHTQSRKLTRDAAISWLPPLPLCPQTRSEPISAADAVELAAAVPQPAILHILLPNNSHCRASPHACTGPESPSPFVRDLVRLDLVILVRPAFAPVQKVQCHMGEAEEKEMVETDEREGEGKRELTGYTVIIMHYTLVTTRAVCCNTLPYTCEGVTGWLAGWPNSQCGKHVMAVHASAAGSNAFYLFPNAADERMSVPSHQRPSGCAGQPGTAHNLRCGCACARRWSGRIRHGHYPIGLNCIPFPPPPHFL
ncbi:hypothetical protein FIBSPDRAFT_890276 [Athelia psychrophila]|uniref:Uncharacterized protein n=1 Tax=Athelia psychrophila TaxID=1759441 RepID=A0A166L7F5_9AGAM|nr:hypothetical protein FIBSPDRAFT_890276 [Fibularhizoctonia sp. CBS 109695]